MRSAGFSEPEVNRLSVVDPPPFNDIGALLDPKKSVHEICDLATNLSLDMNCSFFTTILYHLLLFSPHSLMGINAGVTTRPHLVRKIPVVNL